MIVYGDTPCWSSPLDKLARLRDDIENARRSDGVVRHDHLVSAFIEAGELAQGLADAEWRALGHDAVTPLQDALAALLIGLARQVGCSWTSDFAAAEPGRRDLDGVARFILPDKIEVKRPEGYAFYALYPEGYFVAASGLRSRTRVIGLRSIGTGLAAMVAARAGTRSFATLRPTGHPFRRRYAVEEGLLKRLSDRAAGAYALVDEGPGLSGSSLGGLADLLEDRGVDSRRIIFFPSHAGGLGPEAAPRHIQRWRHAERRATSFDDLVLPRLPAAVADLTGPPTGPPEDVSGGAWRGLSYAERRDWPPVDTTRERRKFLLRSQTGDYLLKFVGLGHIGSEALAKARALHAAGFAVEPLGLRLGFLVERWRGDLRPMRLDGIGRLRLIEILGRYLGFRTRLRSRSPAGADLEALGAMASHNIGEALGADAEAGWRRRTSDLAGLPPIHRVETDNRLHAWEWLSGGSTLIKTDALDHSHGHDLIGCQDIAWDVAGSRIEFDLDDDETEKLRRVVGSINRTPVEVALIAWYIPAYLAFEIGRWSMAATTADAEESRRIDALLNRYKDKLKAVLN